MDEGDRREYLGEVQGDSSIVGAELPATVEVGDEEIQLDKFLIETRKVEQIPSDAAETIDEAKRVLRQERRERLDRLEHGESDHEAAERLVEEINGFDRALNALENIRRPEFGDVAQTKMVDDYERWLGFLDQVKR